MTQERRFVDTWAALGEGVRAAFVEQWAGLAAGGLACGAAIVDSEGVVIASGRNHAYDSVRGITTKTQYPLQHNRLAHAELNALAHLPTERDHAPLTLWSTQHPCQMCVAAVSFTGIGMVGYVADDLSDESALETIISSRNNVPYQALGDPLWWVVSNLLFLYTPAVRAGADAGSIEMNQQRYPDLISLTLALAQHDSLGQSARSGMTLPEALTSYYTDIVQVAKSVSI